jgi:putative protease
MYKPELVSPAGNFEKLKTAIQFGADAIYLGDKKFSLRAGADNFSLEEIKNAVDYAHTRKVKAYITVNLFARNREIEEIRDYILLLKDFKIDGIVVSDPGVFTIIREIEPSIPIHLSTQANTLNYKAIKFWERLGVSRIILARELTYEEIVKIRGNTSLELEVFIHGAMCMAYSGRCLLSSYMTGRDANKGDCAHPCRYKYNLKEEKRPGEYFPIEEDEKGSYILSARDLCAIEYIHKFMQIGIDGFKIEGRMKGFYYLAVVTRAYRRAIDSYLKDPKKYVFDPEWKEDLFNITHRKYTSGFYFEKDKSDLQIDSSVSSADKADVASNVCTGGAPYMQRYGLVGIITEKHPDNKFILKIKNKIMEDDEIEVVTPKGNILLGKIERFYDEKGNIFKVAQPNQTRIIELNGDLEEGWLLVKKQRTDN